MKFKHLSFREQLCILQCIGVLLSGEFLEDDEIRIRLGINRQELASVISRFPHFDDTSLESIDSMAINGCLNEVCNGLPISGRQWQQIFPIGRDEMNDLFQKWRRGFIVSK